MRHVTKISILIATYNRCEPLRLTLASLFSQNFPLNQVEIVLVVDGSNDGTLDFVRTLLAPCTFTVLEQRNLGQFLALNRGLRVARGEIILFLDDDTICEPGLLRAHAEMHTQGESLLVIGPILVDPRSPVNLVTDWVRAYTDEAMATVNATGRPRPTEIGVHANTSVRREVLMASGGFDEKLSRTLGNIELAIRLLKRGVVVRWQPSAVTRHLYVKPQFDLLRTDAESFGRNVLPLCDKHPDYRPQSALARLGEGSWYKRLARIATVRFPFSPDPLLAIPYKLAELGRSIALIRSAGVQLLKYRMAVVMYRSALREAGSWRCLRDRFGKRVVVLGYHHVGPVKAGTFQYLTVSPKRFEQQMLWLKRHGYTGISSRQWLDWARSGKALPSRSVVITFDDGYADLVLYAFPVLERLGFSASVFVVSNEIGGTNSWDRASGSAAHVLLDKQQISYWAERGIEFGSHSRSHPDLTKISGQQLVDEIEGTSDDLRMQLGSAPICFAYPYGLFNQSVAEHVSCRFAVAYTCVEGLNTLCSDAYSLRRTFVQANDTLADFCWRVIFGFSPQERIVASVVEIIRPRRLFRSVRDRILATFGRRGRSLSA